MCQACDHPQRGALEQDIRAGMAPKLVSDQYGLHPAGVVQHHRRHMLRIPALLDSVQYEAIPIGHDIELARVDEVALPARLDTVENEPSEICPCYWCQMSGYQRLLKAWEAANRSEKERFCIETRTVDVPF